MKHLHHVRIIRVTLTDEPTPKDSTGCDGVYADSEDVTEEVMEMRAFVDAALAVDAVRTKLEHTMFDDPDGDAIMAEYNRLWPICYEALARIRNRRG